MTTEFYAVTPGRRRRSVQTWRLLDAASAIRGEATQPELLADLIAARHMAAILAAIAARTGDLIEQQARYQCAEDKFDESETNHLYGSGNLAARRLQETGEVLLDYEATPEHEAHKLAFVEK